MWQEITLNQTLLHPLALILFVVGVWKSPEEAEEHKGCAAAQFLPLELGAVPSTGWALRKCAVSPPLPLQQLCTPAPK